jgi:hypothetical protein
LEQDSLTKTGRLVGNSSLQLAKQYIPMLTAHFGYPTFTEPNPENFPGAGLAAKAGFLPLSVMLMP